jgi:hypothetical protein
MAPMGASGEMVTGIQQLTLGEAMSSVLGKTMDCFCVEPSDSRSCGCCRGVGLTAFRPIEGGTPTVEGKHLNAQIWFTL